LIFAGTGKTSTLVEAVAQILANKPNSKILISAQSNSACDEIGVRLLKHVSRTKIFRYYSASVLKRNVNDLNDQLLSISNIRNRRVHELSYEEFYHFNVVISTMVSSKRLHQANIKQKHFDYILIDECASAIEPESLIPITGKINQCNINN
jgi:helicase MOV-10